MLINCSLPIPCTHLALIGFGRTNKRIFVRSFHFSTFSRLTSHISTKNNTNLHSCIQYGDDDDDEVNTFLVGCGGYLVYPLNAFKQKTKKKTATVISYPIVVSTHNNGR